MSWAATHTFSVGEVLTANNMNLIQNNINASNPVGALQFVIASSAGNATESVWQGGWLECNAAQVSRSTYAALYNYHLALSPSLPFGNGNGTTTFTLVDLQGGRQPTHHTPGGHADMATLGGNDGTALASRRLKHSHTHTLSISGGSHAHTDAGHSHGISNVDAANHNPSTGSTGYSSGDRSTVNITGTGSGNASINSNTHTHPNGEFSGVIGLGTAPVDTVPYAVAGIWVVKF